MPGADVGRLTLPPLLQDRSHRYRESLACVVNLRRDGRSSGLALLKSLPRSNVLDLEYRLRC